MSQATVPISIALTTYNGERFLKEQLDSLAALRPVPAEVVVCDDCSTDKTMDLLAEFARTAPFPVVVKRNETNIGWRQNFFQAAGLCKSDMIAFCDQDDIWYPQKLGAVAPFFADPEVLLVHHDADVIDEAGIVQRKMRDGENDKEEIQRLSKPTIWSHASGLTMVFRKSLLAFNPYWPDSVDTMKEGQPASHDQWIYHLSSNLGAVRFVKEPLLGYRQHGANQVGYTYNRNNAFTGPKKLKAEIAVHTRMLAGFNKALQRALADGTTGFNAQLKAAVEANLSLARRVELRNTLYNEAKAPRRLALFLKLLASGSYSRSTQWSLGRRALLADFRAVLRMPE